MVCTISSRVVGDLHRRKSPSSASSPGNSSKRFEIRNTSRRFGPSIAGDFAAAALLATAAAGSLPVVVLHPDLLAAVVGLSQRRPVASHESAGATLA